MNNPIITNIVYNMNPFPLKVLKEVNSKTKNTIKASIKA